MPRSKMPWSVISDYKALSCILRCPENLDYLILHHRAAADELYAMRIAQGL